MFGGMISRFAIWATIGEQNDTRHLHGARSPGKTNVSNHRSEEKKMTYEQRTTYTREIHNMTAAQIWAAWKAQEITVGELADWQQRHGIYFDQEGNVK